MRFPLCIAAFALVLGLARAGDLPKQMGAVRSLAYSADGNFLAAASGEPAEPGYATVWQLPTGKQFLVHREPKGIPIVAFSRDGKRLIIGTFTDDAIVVDTATWKIERKLPGHGAAARGALFSHDGQSLAVTSYDGFIHLWETATWTIYKTIDNAHAGWVYAAAFSKDGKLLASSGADHRAKLWDLKTGQCLHVFEQTGIIRHICFTADDRNVVYGSWDGTLAIRERDTGKVVVKLEHAGRADDVAITTDSLLLAHVGNVARLTRIDPRPTDDATLTELRRLMKGWDDDGIAVRDKASKGIAALGTRVADELRKVAKDSPSPEIRLRARLVRSAILSPEPIYKMTHPEGDIESLAFSPDDRALATGGADGIVRLWSVATGQEIQLLRQLPATPQAATKVPRAEY